MHGVTEAYATRAKLIRERVADVHSAKDFARQGHGV
jgi:hypothetical protein